MAFSCCEYDGGRAEKVELDLMREKGWGQKFKRKDRTISPRLNRIDGKCPLTPLEVLFYQTFCDFVLISSNAVRKKG